MPAFEALDRVAVSALELTACARRARYSVIVSAGSAALEFRFCSAEAARILQWRYADQRPTSSDITPFYVVRDGERTLFWRDPGRVSVWRHGALPAEHEVFLADITGWYEFFLSTAALSVHAAVLALDDAAIAIVGASRAGKTSTSIACVRRGMGFLSDERCIIERGRAVPFLRALTLRAAGRALTAPPTNARDDIGCRLALWADDPADVVVQPSRLFGARLIYEPLRLAAVFVLNGYASDSIALPVDMTAIAPAVLHAAIGREQGLGRLRRVFHELRDVRCFRLTLGSPESAAAAIASAVRRG